MVYPWTVTDNVNFIIGYLMGQWKIAIEAFFVICTFINNGKGAVSAGYFIENKYRSLIFNTLRFITNMEWTFSVIDISAIEATLSP